ncbi:Ketoreductase CTB6 [Paramyrothecium foliicola]|nr:Ketoreductase CTB6 [Paramyrothecium foliicola]
MTMETTILITGATGLVGFRVLVLALTAGHRVRYTARSEDKALAVSSNPAIKALAPGDRLSSVVIPDLTVEGTFDSALNGVTHVIHVGSPVPVPTFEPTTQVFEPTVKMTANLLSAASKAPSVRRVVITSSVVANLDPTVTAFDKPASAATRLPAPASLPSRFENVFEAYVLAKIVELHNSDEFVQKYNPGFTVAHVMPGYVFGRNELMLDTTMMQTQNSSNNFLMMGVLGGALPSPLIGVYAHIDDVAETHLRVAFIDTQAGNEPQDFGVASKVDFDDLFGIVENVFPQDVADGIFKKGTLSTSPVRFQSSETEKLLGRRFRSFESAVVDVAFQYLEKLGRGRDESQI